jgi:hypothetical protein
MPNTGEAAEQLECSHIADANAKWYNHFGKQFVSFLQRETGFCQATQQFHCQVFIQVKWKVILTENP